MGVRATFNNRWVQLTIVLVLVLLGAFCFLRYLDWAFAYSGTLGLGSRMRETQLANHRAWLFFCMFIVLEMLCAVLVGLAWEPPNFGSTGLRFVARYGSALALCLLATGLLVGIRVALR